MAVYIRTAFPLLREKEKITMAIIKDGCLLLEQLPDWENKEKMTTAIITDGWSLLELSFPRRYRRQEKEVS